jgi:uncharacterized protein
MPRIIFFLVVGFLIYRYLKRLGSASTARPPAQTGKAIGFAPIAACAVCGVHVPVAESVSSADGRSYCSEAHSRLAHAPGH